MTKLENTFATYFLNRFKNLLLQRSRISKEQKEMGLVNTGCGSSLITAALFHFAPGEIRKCLKYYEVSLGT